MLFKNLSLRLSADVSGYVGPMSAAKASTDGFTRSVAKAAATGSADWKRIGRGMVIAGGLIVAALGAAVGAAIQFEAEMRNVNSIQFQSEEQFAATGDAILAMASRVPQSATTLARGLYDIASSGFQGAEALEILEQSSIAASAGLTTTDVASKGVVAALNAYGLSASSAADISDTLFQTVNLGVISFEDLVHGVGQWVGMAQAAGVGFDEASAAIAAMTLVGIPAAEAGTSLNRTLQALVDPSEALTAQFQALGYETGTAAIDALGLQGTMELLREATGGNVNALLELFPEIRAARGAMALMSNEGENYARVASGITSETARAGAAQRAFEEQSKSLKFQWDQLKASGGALAIEIGQALVPALRPVVDLAADIVSGFSGLPDSWKTVIAVGTALGAVLTILVGAAILLAPGIAAVAGAATAGVLAFNAWTVSMAASSTAATLGIAAMSTLAGALLSPAGLMTMAAVAAGALALGIRGFKQEADRATAEIISRHDITNVQGMTDAMEALRDRHREVTEQYQDQSGFEQFGSALVDLMVPFHNVEDSAADLTAEMESTGNAADVLQNKIEGVGTATQIMAQSLAAAAGLEAPDWNDPNLDQGSVAQYNRDLDVLSATLRRIATEEGIDLSTLVEDDGSIDTTTGEFLAMEVQLGNLYLASQQGTSGAMQIAEALSVVATGSATAAENLDAYTAAIDGSVNSALSAFDAATAFAGSLDDLAAAAAENGAALDINTEAGRANRDAFSSAASDALAHAEAVAQDTGNIGLANYVLAGHVSALQETARAAGYSEEQIAAMVQEMGLTPENLETLVALQGADTAQAELDGLNARQDEFGRGATGHAALTGAEVVDAKYRATNRLAREFELPRTTQLRADISQAWAQINSVIALAQRFDISTYTATLAVNASGSDMHLLGLAQARGGPYQAGRMHLVGEEGPELRVEDHNGYTFTAGQTARIMAESRAIQRRGGRQAGGSQVVLPGPGMRDRGGNTIANTFQLSFPKYIGSEQQLTASILDALSSPHAQEVIGRAAVQATGAQR